MANSGGATRIATDTPAGSGGAPNQRVQNYGIAAQVAIGICQVSIALLIEPLGLRIVAFLVLVVTGLILALWTRHKFAMPVFALALVVTLMLVLAPEIVAAFQRTKHQTSSNLEKRYYVDVLVYEDDDRDGRQQANDPTLAGVPVVVYDDFGGKDILVTGRDGVAHFTLPHIVGFSLGLCDDASGLKCFNFQTHELSSSNDTPDRALRVKVGREIEQSRHGDS